MKVRLPNQGGNMQSMLQQAQKMQEQMTALREELDRREYEALAGGGAVRVKMNGKHKLLELEIDPDIVDSDDIETMQDVIVAAVNEVIRKVDDTEAEEMGRVTGPMSGIMPGGIPGLM